jgi:hypothetical protein
MRHKYQNECYRCLEVFLTVILHTLLLFRGNFANKLQLIDVIYKLFSCTVHLDKHLLRELYLWYRIYMWNNYNFYILPSMFVA